MGYIRHNAIVVTSWKAQAIEAAATRARNIGLTVIGPSEPLVNGYSTFLVCPDGSKEGWPESGIGDERRAKFIEWMNRKRYYDGSSALEWVELSYGHDDGNAKVEATAWDKP